MFGYQTFGENPSLTSGGYRYVPLSRTFNSPNESNFAYASSRLVGLLASIGLGQGRGSSRRRAARRHRPAPAPPLVAALGDLDTEENQPEHIASALSNSAAYLDTERHSVAILDDFPCDIFSCKRCLDMLSIVAMSLSLPDVEFEIFAPDTVKRPLVAAQCRAARGLLNWSQDTLAEASRVGISTVGDFERERRTPCNHLLRDMRSALESAGIEFISENGGGPEGPGVRLRRR